MMTRETAKGYLQFVLIIIFLIVLYALNFALELMKTEPKIQNKQQETPNVNAVTLEETVKKMTFTDTAQVTARSYVPIIPEVTGRILNVVSRFKVGGCFDKNQILFTIDTDDVRAEYKTAQAETQQAQANLALVTAESEAAIAEWKILNPTQKIPPLVAKQPQINQAQAKIATAQARMKLAEVRLKDSEFSYPFAGCVESSQVEVGQFATRGQSLGQVFSRDSLELIVNLPAEKANKLRHTTYEADIMMNDTHYTASIDRISDVIDSQTQFSKIILKPNSIQGLQPNKIATVTFSTKEPQKIFILNTPDIINDTQIALINSDNTITLRDIDVIGRTDRHIYIKAFDTNITIARGQNVALKNKMRVNVVKQ
jgi:RND family efflux transporter MFP subunit